MATLLIHCLIALQVIESYHGQVAIFINGTARLMCILPPLLALPTTDALVDAWDVGSDGLLTPDKLKQDILSLSRTLPSIGRSEIKVQLFGYLGARHWLCDVMRIG